MFSAPEIIANIPDIKQIYEINDKQGDELDLEVEKLDNNIFLETMSKEILERWERILKFSPSQKESFENRKFKVVAKVIERLPYSYRVILKNLYVLCPGGLEFEINEPRTEFNVQISVKSKNNLESVKELLERVLPLNMAHDVSILYTQHYKLKKYTHKQLSKFAHAEIRELE